MTVADAARRAAATLSATARAGDARRDAAILLRHLLEWDTAEWLTRQREPLPAGIAEPFEMLVARRAAGEPVAYLVGGREFYGRAFQVTPDVLIPRPETELLVERALAVVDARGGSGPVDVVDVGTGSGCIAVTVACERPRVRVMATDVSPAALRVARGNVDVHGVAGRVTLVEASLTGPARGVDLIVSNPPYVPLADRDGLMRDVRDFEPAGALFAGDDGLAVIRALAPAAARALKPGGVLMMEIGTGQAPEVRSILERQGFVDVTVSSDLAGHDRVVGARLPATSV